MSGQNIILGNQFLLKQASPQQNPQNYQIEPIVKSSAKSDKKSVEIHSFERPVHLGSISSSDFFAYITQNRTSIKIIKIAQNPSLSIDSITYSFQCSELTPKLTKADSLPLRYKICPYKLGAQLGKPEIKKASKGGQMVPQISLLLSADPPLPSEYPLVVVNLKSKKSYYFEHPSFRMTGFGVSELNQRFVRYQDAGSGVEVVIDDWTKKLKKVGFIKQKGGLVVKKVGTGGTILSNEAISDGIHGGGDIGLDKEEKGFRFNPRPSSLISYTKNNKVVVVRQLGDHRAPTFSQNGIAFTRFKHENTANHQKLPTCEQITVQDSSLILKFINLGPGTSSEAQTKLRLKYNRKTKKMVSEKIRDPWTNQQEINLKLGIYTAQWNYQTIQFTHKSNMLTLNFEDLYKAKVMISKIFFHENYVGLLVGPFITILELNFDVFQSIEYIAKHFEFEKGAFRGIFEPQFIAFIHSQNYLVLYSDSPSHEVMILEIDYILNDLKKLGFKAFKEQRLVSKVDIAKKVGRNPCLILSHPAKMMPIENKTVIESTPVGGGGEGSSVKQMVLREPFSTLLEISDPAGANFRQSTTRSLITRFFSLSPSLRFSKNFVIFKAYEFCSLKFDVGCLGVEFALVESLTCSEFLLSERVYLRFSDEGLFYSILGGGLEFVYAFPGFFGFVLKSAMGEFEIIEVAMEAGLHLEPEKKLKLPEAVICSPIELNCRFVLRSQISLIEGDLCFILIKKRVPSTSTNGSQAIFKLFLLVVDLDGFRVRISIEINQPGVKGLSDSSIVSISSFSIASERRFDLIFKNRNLEQKSNSFYLLSVSENKEQAKSRCLQISNPFPSASEAWNLAFFPKTKKHLFFHVFEPSLSDIEYSQFLGNINQRLENLHQSSLPSQKRDPKIFKTKFVISALTFDSHISESSNQQLRGSQASNISLKTPKIDKYGVDIEIKLEGRSFVSWRILDIYKDETVRVGLLFEDRVIVMNFEQSGRLSIDYKITLDSGPRIAPQGLFYIANSKYLAFLKSSGTAELYNEQSGLLTKERSAEVSETSRSSILAEQGSRERGLGGSELAVVRVDSNVIVSNSFGNLAWIYLDGGSNTLNYSKWDLRA